MSKIIIEPVLELGAAEQSLAQFRNQFQRVEQAAKKAGEQGAKSIAGANAPLQQQGGILTRLRTQYGQLQQAIGAAESEAEIKRLNAELKQTGDEIQRIQGLGQQQGPLQSFFSGAADFVKGGLIVGAIEQVGGAITDAAGEVAGLVRGFEQFQIVVSQTTGLTGAALQQQTAQLTAAAQTFGKDQQELLIASNSVAQQFGISQQEALGLIEEGFIKGADANGEFLSILKEYPAQFRAAGLNAEQFIASTVVGAQQGIFSDKAADTIKEFGLRIREETGPTRDALINAFGQTFTDELLESVRNGSITSAQALQQVSAELNRVNPNAQATQQLLADVFSAAGEDAGIDYIRSLETLGQGLNSVGIASAEAEESLRRQLEIEERTAAATAFLAKAFGGALTDVTNFSKEIKATALEALAGLVGFLRDAVAGVTGFVQAIRDNGPAVGLLVAGLALMNKELIVTNAQLLAAAIRSRASVAAFALQQAATNGVALAQKALNLVLRANPIGLVITAIGGLIIWLNDLYDTNERVRATVDGVWAAIQQLGQAMLSLITLDFSTAFDQFSKIGDSFSMGYENSLERSAAMAEEAKRKQEELNESTKTGAKTAEEAAGATDGDTKARDKNAAAITRQAAAQQRYNEQLRFERNELEANGDAIAEATEALREQTREIRRQEQIAASGMNPLQIDILEIRNDTEELRREAEERAANATATLAQQQNRELELIRQQRDARARELADLQATGGNAADIANLTRLLDSYNEEVRRISREAAVQRADIEREAQRNLVAIEENGYQRRLQAYNQYIREQRRAIIEGNEELVQLQEAVGIDSLARTDNLLAQRVSVDLQFTARYEELDNIEAEATERITDLQASIAAASEPAEIEALQQSLALQLQAVEQANIERIRIDQEYRARRSAVEEAATNRQIEETRAAQQRVIDVIESSFATLSSIDGISGLADSYSNTLTQLASIQRRFEDTEAAQRLAFRSEELAREQEDYDNRLAQIEAFERKTGTVQTQARNALARQLDGIREREIALAEDKAQAEADFEQDKFNRIADLAAQTVQAVTQTIGAITDIQIQEVNRLIDTQERAVSEAERLAEEGNSRQLALERERLEELQAERERFVRRQQALALIELVANSSVAIAKAAAEGGAAAPITIAATLAALAVGLAQARAQAQSAAQGFKTGGYTGDRPRDAVAGVVHGREFVINAEATKRHRPLLERINAGERIEVPPLPVAGLVAQGMTRLVSPGVDRYNELANRREAVHIKTEAVRLDRLEAEMRGVRHDLGAVVDAIDSKPVADFRLDEKGWRRRQKTFDRQDAKRSIRRGG